MKNYLLLVDYTSRPYRQGKARLSQEVANILERIGSSAEIWRKQILQLFSKNRLLGSYFAANQSRLRELASDRGVHHLNNLASAAAR